MVIDAAGMPDMTGASSTGVAVLLLLLVAGLPHVHVDTETCPPLLLRAPIPD